MDLLWLLLLGVLIGAVLGGLGGGGAILTVPALVFLVGQSAQDASTSSLVIVGLTATVGVASYLSAGRVRWRLSLVFGLVGFPAAWLGSFLNHRVDENILLLGFSGLMILAAGAMVADPSGSTRTTGEADKLVVQAGGSHSSHSTTTPGTSRPRSVGTSLLDREQDIDAAPRRPSTLAVVAVALAVGLLTGFFGVGGGFVIVPALVLVLRLPMHQAVGTSLAVVALNSVTSLASRATSAHFDWDIIIPFTLAAMVAAMVGKRVADQLPARQLKHGFAALLVLVAGYTAWQSIDGLTHNPPAHAAGTGSPAVAPIDVAQAVGARSADLDGAVDVARSLPVCG